VTGDVADLAAKRAGHKPSPRTGEGVYRHGVPVGRVPCEPMPHEYPLTCICTCGRTIRRLAPEEEWEHVTW
jgi:hypothetical protein